MNKDSFIFTIKIDDTHYDKSFYYGSSHLDIQNNCIVDFGDFTKSKIIIGTNIPTYKYERNGIYNITITGRCNAPISNFSFQDKIIDIKQWGNVEGMVDWDWSFYNCINLINISATDSPNILKCVSMFHNCINFNSDLSKWNVSKVIDFQHMFYNCKKFNSDLSNWNVENAYSFNGMFLNCKKFNSDLSRWNMKNANITNSMFYDCKKFKSDLSKWNVSELRIASYMFANCKNFNSDLSNWNVTNLITTDKMFYNCKNFNSNLSNWNLINIEDFSKIDSFLDNTKVSINKYPKILLLNKL